jgi:hypothetical protein
VTRVAVGLHLLSDCLLDITGSDSFRSPLDFSISQLELTMSHLRQTVFTVALATAAIGALAQTAAQVDAQQKEHQAHVLATEQAAANQPASPADPASAGKMAAMDSKMKAMAEMHQKMMAAKTP